MSAPERAAQALVTRFIRELGKRGAKLAVRRIARLTLTELSVGLLPRVEQHILEHADEVVEKAAHTLFKAGMGKTEILALIENTVKTGGKAVLSEMSESGQFAFVIEKEFGNEIGAAGEKILRVVVDREGRVVTAFAVKKLLERVSIRGILVSAQLAILVFIVTIFDEEADAAALDTKRRYQRIEDEKSWPETVLEWVGPFGIFDSTMIGIEPNFDKIRSRTSRAIAQASQELNRSLSPSEIETIRQSIYDIWADATHAVRP